MTIISSLGNSFVGGLTSRPKHNKVIQTYDVKKGFYAIKYVSNRMMSIKIQENLLRFSLPTYTRIPSPFGLKYFVFIVMASDLSVAERV